MVYSSVDGHSKRILIYMEWQTVQPTSLGFNSQPLD